MSNASLRPSDAKQPDKVVFWTSRAAELKQQLMQRRMPTAIARPENMSSSQNPPEEPRRGEKQPSDQAGPSLVKTITVAQAQSIPGLSHQLPGDSKTLKVTPQLTSPPISNAAEQSMPNSSAPSSAAMTGRLMKKPSPSTPSKPAGKEVNDAPTVGNEAQCDANAPSSTNGAPAITVLGSKVQQGDDSTPKKEQPASHSATKSLAVPQAQSNAESSTEDGEIKTKTRAPQEKKTVQETAPRLASSRNTLATRAPTGTSIVPVKTRAERRVSGPPEAMPASRQRGAQADTALARLSESRSEGGNRHRRASSPVRAARPDRNDRLTWESYEEALPSDRHPYRRASREPRYRSASPVAPRLINEREREVERLACRNPDLQDWLEGTGWNNPEYRTRHLDRLRRKAEIERASSQLKMEFDRDDPRLKEYGEPASKVMFLDNAEPRPVPLARAQTRQTCDVERPKYRKLGPYSVTEGLKRKRSQESDDGRDGGFSPRYYRTSQNHRGSRAGHHDSRGSHQRGHEEPRHRQDRGRRRGGRSPPPRGFAERSPPRSLPQRNSRASHSFASPGGHRLPRNGFEDERAFDRYRTRDLLPPRRLSPRLSSSRPNVRD